MKYQWTCVCGCVYDSQTGVKIKHREFLGMDVNTLCCPKCSKDTYEAEVNKRCKG